MDAKKTIRIGLLSAGARVRGVTRRISAQAAAEGHEIRIIAAYDPNPLALEALAKQLGYDFQHCDTESALTADTQVDWVFIGSWNCHHARQAVLALEAGKNVFCEKPLATTLEDCLKIRDAVNQSGKQFALGLVLRYSPHYRQVMDIIRSGQIGRLISFEFNETLAFNHGGYIFGNWRRDSANAGSHLLEKCCHDLDLANWLAQALPVKVACFGGRDFFLPENERHVGRIGPNSEGRPAYGTWDDPHRRNPFDGEGDIPDNQVAILEYANGVRGTFHTNCNTALPERRFYVCGTEGTLRADLTSGTLEVQRIGWDTELRKIDTAAGDSHGGGDQVMAEAMVATMVKGASPLASVREGIQSAVAAFGLDQAQEENQVVDLRPLWKRAGIDPLGGLEVGKGTKAEARAGRLLGS